MPFQTRITELLGIEHPIIMGGMTGVGTPELAAAVSNAGGLGMIAIHNAGSPEEGRKWIRRLKQLLRSSSSSSSSSSTPDNHTHNHTHNHTKPPFGVNLTILPSMGHTPPPYMEYAQVIIDEGVPIVETAGSNPQKFVTLFQKAGIITIHKCVTIRHALSAERYGVDIISLDGLECAGHPGEDDVGNFVLQAKGRKVLTKPYVCSGGVGDGNQLAAALALGADGVNCGTRFCATQECSWPDSFKQRMLQAQETDTVLMLRSLKNTSRVFKNDVAVQVQQIEEAASRNSKGESSFQFSDVAHLVNGKRGRQAELDGDADAGIWTAGQVIGLIDSIPTCQELIDTMIREAEETIQVRLAGMMVRIPPKSRL
jgi:NAD(P)H-dependent flavin oxidoreductase YrpB (nitropropane dioxygenase family)